MTNIEIKRFIEKIKAGDLIESTYTYTQQNVQHRAVTKTIFMIMRKPYLIRKHVVSSIVPNQLCNSDFLIETAVDIYIVKSDHPQEYPFQQLTFANVKTITREKVEHYKNYSLKMLCSACNRQTSKKICFIKGSSKKN